MLVLHISIQRELSLRYWKKLIIVHENVGHEKLAGLALASFKVDHEMLMQEAVKQQYHWQNENFELKK